ncbi:hypothetical protein N7476_002127 [Penicillium atrosanguineum]|uniref:NmrA-like domain-containing protein n=1 Tax=Penicillium atrosanguineum TaxID=1132637 RepID=A0A9W9Q607_9EURO|nr:hypothetical protein N7476_002127 [Penicillium atrosanguineum]
MASNSTVDPPVIAILGATGTQGQGVVAALLRCTETPFSVLALTRDIASEATQRLQARYQGDNRLKFGFANAYDFESLLTAFKDAYGVFAVTNTRLSGETIESEEDMRHEVTAGQNIYRAAKACGIKHFVMSSLPSISIASSGKFQKVFHFDQKHEIEEMAREELPATFVYPAPLSADKKVDWVDPCYDIGVFVAKIFHLGPQKTASKTYPVVGTKISIRQMADILEINISKRVIVTPSTVEQWGACISAKAGPGYRQDIEQMMEWINVAPDDKNLACERVLSKSGLNGIIGKGLDLRSREYLFGRFSET